MESGREFTIGGTSQAENEWLIHSIPITTIPGTSHSSSCCSLATVGCDLRMTQKYFPSVFTRLHQHLVRIDDGHSDPSFAGYCDDQCFRLGMTRQRWMLGVVVVAWAEEAGFAKNFCFQQSRVTFSSTEYG
jgi:hypothetical protein